MTARGLITGQSPPAKKGAFGIRHRGGVPQPFVSEEPLVHRDSPQDRVRAAAVTPATLVGWTIPRHVVRSFLGDAESPRWLRGLWFGIFIG